MRGTDLEWTLLVLSPVMAVVAIAVVLGILRSSQKKAQSVVKDKRFTRAYYAWRDRILRTGLQPVACPMPLTAGERCFSFSSSIELYEPTEPHAHCSSEALFDMEIGAGVGSDWSILDCFDNVRFCGKGDLCISDRCLYFTGSRKLNIPFPSMHTVAASCSGLMIGARGMDRPLLFMDVNGQVLRDMIHMLMEA